MAGDFRLRKERDRRGTLIRAFGRDGEIAYARLGLSGLQAEVEFPSDWHEQRRAWVRIGIGIAKIAFSFPWSKVVPDEHQCSGPTYGFCFFDDGLQLHWGKQKGRRDDPFTIIGMPWRWQHREHRILSEPETHPYRYRLRSGEVQERTAIIQIETRRWTRPWLPWRRTSRYIDIAFSDEVGERSGSWKGGVLGCSYDMLPNETALDCLRRMERERQFT
jgi:hypothetical protein